MASVHVRSGPSGRSGRSAVAWGLAGVAATAGLLATGGQALAQAQPAAYSLKINEIDYDQPGIDSAEFVEIVNMSACTAPLDGLAMVLINGANNVEYARYPLNSAAGQLFPGQFLVFGNTGVLAPPPALMVELPLNGLQNGAPDAVAIIDTVNLVVIDSFSYEGAITAAVITGFPTPVNLVNGTAFPAADSGTVPASLERALSGVDTENDIADWQLTNTPNPGVHGPSAPDTLIPCCGSSDFDGDGDFGTDADIEAFFRCLAGDCCATCGSNDFNGDGDFGTDADIEAFFRVLAGGSC